MSNLWKDNELKGNEDTQGSQFLGKIGAAFNSGEIDLLRDRCVERSLC